MYCFRENSNFPFSNQKIITLIQYSFEKHTVSGLSQKTIICICNRIFTVCCRTFYVIYRRSGALYRVFCV